MATDSNSNYLLMEGASSNAPAEKVRYRFSPEEYRAIQECNRESFYYRSLPLAATAMFAVQLAVKQGILSSHPRWGSTFKLMGAGFVGWFLGKLSYREKCAEKLMQLPNSQIGESLRRRKLGEESFTTQLQEYKVSDDVKDQQSSLDFQSPKSIDLYPNKATPPSGLDSTYQPSVDDVTKPLPSEESQPSRTFTSYEELRKKNRESVQTPGTSYSSYKTQPSTQSVWEHSSETSRQSKQTTPSKSSGGTTNPYGDVWDD
ncbi:OCIA domain-containing protein 1-like [Centruroides sculpturatus]|uniref:OCIA domain-containing protein 1-like n=1 Tax=Centruroides sculpturatus TaxID=218467 RepID=UPI000C6D673F|nr:OCIA domain-containing protein 1-like [Centruroides sculpturatus]